MPIAAWTAEQPGKEKSMTITEVFQKVTTGEAAGWAIMALILILSLIEISPIKLNPWKHFFKWIGKQVNGETDKKLEELQKQVLDMWVNSHRSSILIFAREARDGMQHSSDEWTNVLNQAEEYERYVRTHNISNGIITQDTEYIRNLYQELSREHRI